ncbi:tetratricopeptide repeat protein [Hyalangium gracile]|uniref:tetratricopeptide repeat protein n=1 Tax=Hyalangium gracile TaxID=394092 RepID=UPI001CCC4CD4|nr:tetratricopeptide repeat protein [Hyalangium gracile]
MGFFDRLFGRAAPPAPSSPDALRERLFDAVQSGDGAALARLCTEHEAAILEHFPSWQNVPEEIRRDRTRLQRYGQGLVSIARYFAETRSRPELLQRLMGPPAENPIMRWEKVLARSEELMGGLDFEGALALLTPEEERIRGISGGSAESIRAMTLGQMATCHFQSGRPEVAIPLYRQALELCRKAQDEEGIAAYLGSLFEVLRYLGSGAEAAAVAAEYSQVLERSGQAAQARRFRKISDIVRAGEPLNRVVAEFQGTPFELDELPALIDGPVRFIFCRNRLGLARAMSLVERGRELGSQNRFEEALPLFREASQIDPHAPEPLYDEAVTLLSLERAGEAMARYDQVEALAPGWFHCRAERWLASGIAAGRIPQSAFSLLRMLENPGVDVHQRVQLATQGISEAPRVPAFHLQLTRDLARLGRETEARQVLAEGLEVAEEPDIRSRLLVESARQEAPSPVRDRKLHEAMAPGGNLVAAATAVVMLRVGQGQGLLH